MLRRVLVANRGEIARRVIRSARTMGIGTVAVFSDPDASAPHVGEADRAVRLPGATAGQTYLRIDALLAAARAGGADSVHPGYGFLSENPDFARACAAEGLVFVGPPAHAMEKMASKVAAKATVAAAGVPVLPSVTVAAGDARAQDGSEAAAALGWPVLVKASAGGGGRGMRVVAGPDQLGDALASAAREAEAAFGDGTVFLEPYLLRARHVEVQVVGDHHGTVVHLFERDCSVQRRHQKVVEECPSPVVDERLRQALGEAALAAARSIGYVGAGTVEFLVDGERFVFLEMNTRLQVEHPVTEAVTGLDLVRLQLLVAGGEPLPPEVLGATVTGHAIEARLYAEDPRAAWRPSAGRLHRLDVPGVDARFEVADRSGPTLRLDSAVEDGGDVSVHYDPMLAKVVAHAPSRREAAARLADALARAEIHGLVTNRDLLVAVLRHPEFLAGEADTGFLERHDPAVLGAARPDDRERARLALVAALGAQARRRREATVLGGLPSGWRNNPSQPQAAAFVAGDGERRVAEYRFDRRGRCVECRVDGVDLHGVEVVDTRPEAVVLDDGGVRRRYRIHQVQETSYVDGPEGAESFAAQTRFPLPGSADVEGSLSAPLPGLVVRVAVAPGSEVRRGDTLVAIEAMKMEHAVLASADGTVASVLVSVGDQVEPGQALVVVEGG